MLSAWVADLKSSSTGNLHQKLEWAMEHLVSNSIHHPGKVRFLLEWQSAVLLHKKGGASNADNDEWDFCISLLLTRMNGNLIQNDRLPPIAQTPCWTFMRELLRRVCDEPVLPPLKYPLIPILSQWIRYWLTVEDLNGDRLKTFEEQLGLVLDCWTLLSEKLHRYLLATVDQTLQLSSDVLDLFTQVMQLQSVLTKTAFLFKGVWTYFLDYVTKQGNLKKMFSFTAETTLGPILFIYAQLSQAPSTSLDSSTVTSIRALCEAYISKTLFHADHIKEIGLPLKGRVSLDESTVPFTKNYTSVLLDQLVKLAEKKSLLWETQVQGLPFLLKQLITSLPPVTDKVPQQTALVFSFFQFLDGLLSVSNATFDSQEVLHKTRYDMLLLLSQNSIYRPTNDSLSKEQSLHLEKLANNLLLVNTHKAHVWKTWSILLRMDYMLVESRISELLCDMTNSESEADAMELAQHLMSVFHKSRKLDMFLIHVLDSKATTEKSVFFHSATLQVLAHSVSTSLPAQSMHLFVTLVDYLVDLFEASPSSAAQVKKSKKSSRNEPSYEMVSAVPTVTFLEVVVRHMRVSTGQVQAFSQTSQKIKEKIIEPAFDMLEKASTTKDFANIAAARIVPALRLHYQLMSSFDAYWTDFVTGKEIVKILKKTKKLTDYTAIVEMRTRIALLHVDRLASTCLDPKSDSRCIDIIQRLDDLTSLNVASYTFDHLSAVCRIASQDQIQAIVTWLINALTTQDSAIHRIFQSATFFEVGPIRNGFLTAWINAVIENAAKAFLPANAAAKEVHSILGQVVGSDLKTLTEKVDTFIGNKLVPSFKTKSKGRQELDRLISGLCLFPIHYFTVSERRQIIVILYILHVMFWSTEDFSRECFTRLLWVLDKFVDECQDSFLMVHSPRLISSLMQATESSEDTSPLTQSSVSIFRVTIQTVLKKPNSTAYILETLRWIISSAKGQLFAVEFLKIANESLAMKKSRDTIDLDGELRKSVSEFIKRIEFASENNLDMTSQVMRFYHLTGQEELSLSSFSALVQRQSESLEVEVKMFNMVCQWINILKQDIMPLVKHLKRGWDLLAKDRGVITGFESLLHTSTDTEQAVVMGSIMSQFECHSVDVSDLLLMVLYLFKSDNIQVGKLLPGYRINEPLNHLFTCIRIDKRFETLQAILELLVSLSVNKKIQLKTFQVGQILSVISQLSAGSHMMPEFAVSERESLFHHVYLILNGLVRHRRESVLHVIPHLFRALRDLLQCFREDPLNIPLALKTDDSSPPFCAILCPRLKPLGVKPAALYSDLVLSLTQRPLLEVTSGSSGSDETHLMTQTASFIKPFSKHAPMLLLAMVSIQSSRRPFDIDCKKELTQGIYYLLDLCNDHGRSFALAALDANGGGRPILKTWVSDWEKYHRFRGDA